MANEIATIARAHWRQFAWVWAFPVILLGSVFMPAFARNPPLFFFCVDLPVLLVCVFVASKPVRNREVSFKQGFLLIIVAPLVMWAMLIFALFGLGALLDDVGR